jgi:hypothetical protein
LELLFKAERWLEEQANWLNGWVERLKEEYQVFEVTWCWRKFAVEKACKQHHLGLQFELSEPRTPQRYGKVERKFQTLYGRIWAMFNDSGIVDEIRDGFWAECASTASFYENRIVNKETQQSPLQLMYNKQFKGSKNLKNFGETWVVTTKKTIQGKLNDKGTFGLFVAYPDNHANDVYRIFNIKPNKSSSREI